MKQKIKTFILFGLITFLPANALIQGSTYATSFCVSAKCKAAEAAEVEATEKANNANTAAKTLEGEVERLKDEINALQARINANEAIAEDLAKTIAENEEKLSLQQSALAKMLVDMHLEGEPDAIMILASSSSISDYAEKQSRLDTVKTQVNLSAQAVKSLKEELEKQKVEVDRILEDQKLQQANINAKKTEQTNLIAKYRDNAEAFAAEAEAARNTKRDEIAKEIARLNSTGAIGDGINSYPYRGVCPAHDSLYVDDHGWGAVCQCTSYAGYKAYEWWGAEKTRYIYYLGDARYWVNAPYRVDQNPAPFTIAVSQDGYYGHVMWVESVNSNGTINISEF